ncbi:DUF4244 domain-containing protein [Sinomonas soli]
MSAQPHRNDVRARPDQSSEPARLELAPGAGPRPDALGASEETCRIIELFPPGSPRSAEQRGQDRGEAAPRASELGTRPAALPVPREDRGVRRRPRRRARVLGTRVRRRTAVRVQLLRLWLEGRGAGEHGMATAEYAIATLGAVAFAGLLVVIMRSDEVRGFLLAIIRQALALP